MWRGWSMRSPMRENVPVTSRHDCGGVGRGGGRREEGAGKEAKSCGKYALVINTAMYARMTLCTRASVVRGTGMATG